MRRVGRAYIVSVTVAGLAVLAGSAIAVWLAFPGPRWLLLLALTVTTAVFVVRMRAAPLTVSLSDAFVVAATLLFGPAAGALTVAADALVMSLRLKRIPDTPRRLLFNTAAPALALFVSAHLFFRLAGRGPLDGAPLEVAALVGPLLVFAATYFLLNSWLVAGALTLENGQLSVARIWRRHFLPLALTHVGGVALGVLLVYLDRAAGAGVAAAFLLPVALALAMALSHAAQRLRQRSTVYAELRGYAAALRSTADAIVLTDADGRVTYLNPVAERLTGWSSAEARGRAVGDVLTAADGEVASTGDEQDAPREYSLARRDGTVIPIEQTEALIRDEDGLVLGTIRAFRDIRPRRRLEAVRQALHEREREARAAADAANRTKDEFLATLSHELRTPATAILGWTTLLRSGRLDDATTHRALAALDRSARAQATVLNDIVDVSRIVRGMLKLDIRRVDLRELVAESVETIEPAAAAREIEVRAEVGEDVPIIDADPARLRQVLWNLLSNAVKFARIGGHVSISVKYGSGVITILVVDDGYGIAPAFLPFVFDRFRQEDSSDRRVHEGLGLGLSIVKELVAAHGGSVSVESEGRNRGARFTVTLPALRRQREGDPDPQPEVSPTPRRVGEFRVFPGGRQDV
jgi:PAS domain S-box-containing protein